MPKKKKYLKNTQDLEDTLNKLTSEELCYIILAVFILKELFDL